MKFLIAACLAGTLLLAGCATGTGPATVSPAPDNTNTTSSASVYPNGPLTPITTGRASSQSVVQ
ncbi:MAG: lytic transglycosylase, partial [Comamonadaceae bacterium]